MLKTQINGETVHFTPQPDDSAVDLIRDTCGLTGTKLVCGSGACGACTVLVDGIPMTSCLLPAHHIEGKTIETAEQYQGDSLHPMQKAFMVHDGLQCGYCTPGFIMESIAFYNSWRAKHGTEKPTKEHVAEALAGHLCRCGAYDGIYEAVQRACAGEYDKVESVRAQRVDALEKVTGQAKYTTDIQLEGQLVGGIYRSPHGHARIRNLSTAAAEQLEGLFAIHEMLPKDNIVRYVGEPMVAIAAKDQQTLQHAFDALDIEFELMPAVVGIENAMSPDAPALFSDLNMVPTVSEYAPRPGTLKGNVRTTKGRERTYPAKAQAAFNEMEEGNGNLFEATYVNGIQVHTALEPHCAVAHWIAPDQLDVYMSTQSVTLMQKEIAQHFNLRAENVNIIADYVGGGFGAKIKLDKETIAAIELAKKSGRPVSVIPDRPAEMSTGGMRPGNKTELRFAIDANNALKAVKFHSYNDSGIGVSQTQAGLSVQVYKPETHDLQDYDVVNNGGLGAAFRGPGGPGVFWAMEQAIDQYAHDAGIDSLELRRNWTENALRLKLYDWVEQHEAYQNRPQPDSQTEQRYRRGIGISFGQWYYFYDPDTTVRLETSPSGFTIKMATQDIGNGVKTSLARIVAQTFGVEPESINLEIGSSKHPHGPTAGGSRVTPSVYTPTEQAAQLMRDRLFGVVAEEFDLDNPSFVDGGLQHQGGFLSWEDALQTVPPQHVEVRRGGDNFVQGAIHGIVFKRVMGLDIMIGQGSSQGAVIAEVEVDTLLGKVKVTRVWENLAIGKAHFPDMAMSQVKGGVYQGMGYALYEEKIFDPNTAALLTSNLQDYRLPGIGDIPEVTCEFTDGGFEHAKGEGVGLAELSTMPVAAAIANAVFNATGVRCTESPITPERLIQALQSDITAASNGVSS
ncbi:MAG: molybdopterin-dependent oxidoreductase [Chloroflexota bacterium]